MAQESQSSKFHILLRNLCDVVSAEHDREVHELRQQLQACSNATGAVSVLPPPPLDPLSVPAPVESLKPLWSSTSSSKEDEDPSSPLDGAAQPCPDDAPDVLPGAVQEFQAVVPLEEPSEARAGNDAQSSPPKTLKVIKEGPRARFSKGSSGQSEDLHDYVPPDEERDQLAPLNKPARPKIVGLRNRGHTGSILKKSMSCDVSMLSLTAENGEESAKPKLDRGNSVSFCVSVEASQDQFSDSGSEDSAHEHDSQNPNSNLQVHSIWDVEVGERKTKTLPRGASRAGGAMAMAKIRGSKDSASSFEGGSARSNSKRIMQELTSGCRARISMCTPNSRWLFWWELTGMLWISYDIIMIPMAVFSLQDNAFLHVMTFATGIFWLLDMVRNFFTGYYSYGEIVMDLRRVAWRYVTTWFCLDVCVVLVDWLVVLGKYTRNSAFDFGLNLHTLRSVRVFRLLRSVKMGRILKMIEDRITSESTAIVVDMVKRFIGIVIMCHVCACTWYGIGKAFMSKHPSWMNVYLQDVPDDDVGYRYATSFHWALTQFTPASISVQPHNKYERTFAIVVLLFALVTVSSFVSGITNAVMFLHNLGRARSKEFWLLRRYLREARVPVPLALRIQRWCDFVWQSQQQQVKETNVSLLNMLSQGLRTELNNSIFAPRVTCHPFCILISKIQDAVFDRICNNSVSMLPVVRGDTVFTSGFEVSTMYIFNHGELWYEPNSKKHQGGKVGQGVWACEQAVWSKWCTVGAMTAQSHCDVTKIDSAKFGAAIHSHQDTRCEAVTYAKSFVQGHNKLPAGRHTDLYQSGLIEGLWLRLYTEYNIKRTTIMTSSVFSLAHELEKLSTYSGGSVEEDE